MQSSVSGNGGLAAAYTGSGTKCYSKIFYEKTISVEFCNITMPHLSTPYDIVSEMFQLKPQIATPISLPYHPHSSSLTSASPCNTLFGQLHIDFSS